MLLVVILFTVILVYVANKLWTFRKDGYWEKRGVPGPKPSLIFGNTKDLILVRKTMGEVYGDIYNRFENMPYVGIYNLHTPNLLLRDPSLIRDVLVKDFNSFHDNPVEADEKVDPLGSKNPFVLKGEKWKETRAQLMPIFAAAKMKSVVPNLLEVGDRMMKYIRGKNSNSFNAKDLLTRFTTDNVFSVMYSIDAKSFDEGKAELWKMIREMFCPSFALSMKFTLLFFMPRLAALLNIGFFPKKLQKSLLNLTAEIRESRAKNKIVKDDLLDAMVELKNKKTGQKFDDMEIAAYTAGFIADGLETSAVALSFMIYELAENQDIQQKLYEEIKSVLESKDGIISYEAIQDMPYLDCVFNESLRKHPPGLALTKLCTEDYALSSVNENSGKVLIEKGTVILLPLYAIHMDPKFFPKPEVFDPDRFSPDNRHNIPRGAFLPWGDGPRICIGQRFAQTQVKVGVIALLRNFRILPDSRTKKPLELDPQYFMKEAKGGLWIKFVERNGANH